MSAPSNEESRPKRSRASFTNAQRLQICNHRDQNPSLTQTQLAAWAQEALGLPRQPSQAMISKLLKRKNDLESMTTEELTSKSRRTVRFPTLDTALARWVSYCEETGVPVTGESIRAKATTFSKILHIDDPLTFSNGWLFKFNERHGFGGIKGFKHVRSAAEAAGLDLQRRLQQFDPENIFAMDETALLFSLFPDRTGRRTTKRVTIALSCNADGSEKLPLLFIGKAEKPRGFTSSTAAEFNYTHNANSFMTREIFTKWIEKVDAKFGQQQRKCPKAKPAEDGGLGVEELKERLKWIAKLLIYADEKGVSTESVSGMRVLQRDFRDQLNKKQASSR
ncbi:hypothetical protein PRNP1_006108 [Phytophthora ramorum]